MWVKYQKNMTFIGTYMYLAWYLSVGGVQGRSVSTNSRVVFSSYYFSTCNVILVHNCVSSLSQIIFSPNIFILIPTTISHLCFQTHAMFLYIIHRIIVTYAHALSSQGAKSCTSAIRMFDSFSLWPWRMFINKKTCNHCKWCRER